MNSHDCQPLKHSVGGEGEDCDRQVIGVSDIVLSLLVKNSLSSLDLLKVGDSSS